MGVFQNNLLAGAAGQSGAVADFYDFKIEQSLRIGSGDTLRRTPSVVMVIEQFGHFQHGLKELKLDDPGGQYQVLESGASGNQDTRLFYGFESGNGWQASSGKYKLWFYR